MNRETETYHYPWARNLFLVVLYVGILVFLWHFPLEGTRAFFRELMGGFLYLLAGLILLGVTALLIFSLLPAAPAEADAGFDFEALEDEEAFALEGLTLGVPAFRDPARVEAAWDALSAFRETVDVPTALIVDERAGVIMLSSDEEWGSADLLHELSRHFVDAGFKVKRVTV